tara:strand:+ start:34 stop:252 length:219 start_codon:yes stop_codon:yes gene_type:complete
LQSNYKDTFILLSKVAGIGWFIAISLSLFGLLGVFLDNKFSTGPIFLILGVIIGSFVSFSGIFRIFKKFNNK